MVYAEDVIELFMEDKMENKKCEHLNVECIDCGEQIYRGLKYEDLVRMAKRDIRFFRDMGYEDAYIMTMYAREKDDVSVIALKLLETGDTKLY